MLRPRSSLSCWAFQRSIARSCGATRWRSSARWTRWSPPSGWPRAIARSKSSARSCPDLIDFRRRNPEGAHQGEVLESLIFGEHEGRRLSQEELVQNCIFLLNAGHETTTSLVGNSIGLLLDWPDQHRLLLEEAGAYRHGGRGIPAGGKSLQIGNRLAGEDIALSSGVIPKGPIFTPRLRRRTATPRSSPIPTAWTSRASRTGISPSSPAFTSVLARRWHGLRGGSRSGASCSVSEACAGGGTDARAAGAVPGLCQPANLRAVVDGVTV